MRLTPGAAGAAIAAHGDARAAAQIRRLTSPLPLLCSRGAAPHANTHLVRGECRVCVRRPVSACGCRRAARCACGGEGDRERPHSEKKSRVRRKHNDTVPASRPCARLCRTAALTRASRVLCVCGVGVGGVVGQRRGQGGLRTRRRQARVASDSTLSTCGGGACGGVAGWRALWAFWWCGVHALAASGRREAREAPVPVCL